MSDYRLEMTSEEFGREVFEYDTLEEAKAGQARIEEKCELLNDGIEREFTITRLNHECDNCGETYGEDELDEIEDYHQRVDAGGLVPSGECPADGCGALCYPRDALAKFRAGPQILDKTPSYPPTLVDKTGDGRDYEMVDGAKSVWVIVDGVSLWIRRGEEPELVMVEAYRLGDEEGEPMWTKEAWVA